MAKEQKKGYQRVKPSSLGGKVGVLGNGHEVLTFLEEPEEYIETPPPPPAPILPIKEEPELDVSIFKMSDEEFMMECRDLNVRLKNGHRKKLEENDWDMRLIIVQPDLDKPLLPKQVTRAVFYRLTFGRFFLEHDLVFEYLTIGETNFMGYNIMIARFDHPRFTGSEDNIKVGKEKKNHRMREISSAALATKMLEFFKPSINKLPKSKTELHFKVKPFDVTGRENMDFHITLDKVIKEPLNQNHAKNRSEESQ